MLITFPQNPTSRNLSNHTDVIFWLQLYCLISDTFTLGTTFNFLCIFPSKLCLSWLDWVQVEQFCSTFTPTLFCLVGNLFSDANNNRVDCCDGTNLNYICATFLWLMLISSIHEWKVGQVKCKFEFIHYMTSSRATWPRHNTCVGEARGDLISESNT